MQPQLLLPFLAFALVASATPGPNNLLLLATAASRGLRRCLPLIAGVSLGFGFMVAVVGIGLSVPLALHPGLQTAMRWIGAAWMLWLAWHIARADGIGMPAGRGDGAPIGFLGMCAFQWVNPKAWIMAMATAATYTVPGADLRAQVLVLAGLFVLVSVPSATAWALLGVGTGRFLSSTGRQRTFNRIMGLLLAASVVPALLD